jgi:hypothetical protein
MRALSSYRRFRNASTRPLTTPRASKSFEL